MNFLWISGWAVPPAWLAGRARTVFPHAHHTTVSPSDAAAATAAEKFDVLGGYSLGSLWLLMHAKDFPKNLPVILLAPIFSFAAENGEGGRVTLAQLRLQRRRFRNDAPAAVTDFYRRSGLEHIVPAVNDLTAEQITALDTELGWLESWRAASPPPKHWFGFIGGNDPLLDAKQLRTQWSELQIVAEADHAPYPLLQAAATVFQAKARP
jgi:hypothetical protein